MARARAAQAVSLVQQYGADADVFVTEHPGHARELTHAALARGAGLVLAWGGDGTINEVASALAFRDMPLAIVPSGSGNGLARDLRIPFQTDRAFAAAFGGRQRCIDAGELDGHLFFNVAGVGLDAQVAHRFGAGAAARRGFLRYVQVTVQELFTYEADEHTVVIDGTVTRVRALLIAIANSRQYGNGAIVAPDARMDDGRLDVVIVGARSPLRALVQVPWVFAGAIARVPHISIRTGVEIEISSGHPVRYHVDGEPHVGGAIIAARVHERALRVAVPEG